MQLRHFSVLYFTPPYPLRKRERKRVPTRRWCECQGEYCIKLAYIKMYGKIIFSAWRRLQVCKVLLSFTLFLPLILVPLADPFNPCSSKRLQHGSWLLSLVINNGNNNNGNNNNSNNKSGNWQGIISRATCEWKALPALGLIMSWVRGKEAWHDWKEVAGRKCWPLCQKAHRWTGAGSIILISAALQLRLEPVAVQMDIQLQAFCHRYATVLGCARVCVCLCVCGRVN